MPSRDTRSASTIATMFAAPSLYEGRAARRTSAAGAVLAAPLILRSRLVGAHAPSHHLRLAAIGCGGRSQGVVLKQLAPQADARVVVACDCFAERREKMAAALKFKGYDFRCVMGDGAHDRIHGGAILPDILRWLWRDGPN